MLNRTSLYEEHVRAGGKMVDFSGWEMPLHYGSQVGEHHKVRKEVGMFDVSHMTVIDITGTDAKAYLQYLLANDVGRLVKKGKALYSCMLNENAGVIDDLIVYYMNDDWYRMVVNAATREKDLRWLEMQAKSYQLTLTEQKQLAMIALQGPVAEQKLIQVLSDSAAKLISTLKPFNAVEIEDYFIARTGYTGEDGFEIILAEDKAVGLWQALAKQGVTPIGLGARDTLRLEAGMNLYGTDMDEQTTPLESGLAWTIAWEPEDRDFIGRAALQVQRQSKPEYKLVGLVLQDKGVLRNHQKVIVEGVGEGQITSGSFSPTLAKAIALARVPVATAAECSVEIRGRLMKAKVVKYPFVRKGKSCLA